MLPAGRIRPALALGFAAGVYLLALTASTRFGLGLGMDQLTGAAGVVRSGADYGADLPTVLGGSPGGAAAPDLLADPWRATHWVSLNAPAPAAAVFKTVAGGAAGSTPKGTSPTATAVTTSAIISATVATAASTKKAAAGGHEGDGDSDGKDGRGAKDDD